MKRILWAFFLPFLFSSIEGCVQEGSRIVTVGAPHFVPQSQPDSLKETGIGQDPATGGMFLQWYSVEGAAGYSVYRSDTTDASGNPVMFSMVANVSSESALNDTSTVDGEVTTGVRYYYYLRAYGSDGTLSGSSDTTSYAILARPIPVYPNRGSTLYADGLYFSWQDHIGGGFAVIRVKNIMTIPANTIWITPRFVAYGASAASKAFNFDSTATSPLQTGKSYQWRVDRFELDSSGRPYEGSRSVWSTFTVK